MQFIGCIPGQNVKIRINPNSEIKQVIFSRIVYGLLKFSSSKFLLFFELIVNQTKNTKLERSGGQCSQNFLVHQVRALNQRKLRATNILVLQTKAIRRFVVTEKATTRAFSWLKGPTSAFTYKTLLRHYAKWTLIHGKYM